jgi:arabinose-5-phosphate isomerase
MNSLLPQVIDKILVNNLQAIESLKNIGNDINLIESLDILDKTTKSNGKIIICGIGKSSYISKKISSTLCSIGRCSVFLHPSEACHGDLGLISKNDCIIFISNSGESQEMINVIQYSLQNKISSIAITRKKDSYLARNVGKVILLTDISEGFLNINAPSTSSTQALILGDIIASYLASLDNITTKEYNKYHPGGKIGKLSSPIERFMRTEDQLPLVKIDASFNEALIEISSKKLGIVIIVEDNGEIAGLISDGDVRRLLTQNNIDISQIIAIDVATRNPKTASREMIGEDAVKMMLERKITALIISDNNKPIGVVQLYDLQ